MKTLIETLATLNIKYKDEQIQKLWQYLNELIKWNEKTNLTGSSSVKNFVKGPLFDALTIIPVLKSAGSFVDIGSGAGLPGIPVTILNPNLSVTLVEPRVFRATFLKHIDQKFSLNTKIIETKDKELKDNQWDAAIAQAVWPPDKWLNHALRLVKKGGLVYVLSSKPVFKEILPGNSIIEKKFEIKRPMDNASRFAYRIRL